MASRYHWIQGGIDMGWPSNFAALPLSPLTIPAGGIVKRFMGRGMSIEGVITGIGYTAVSPWNFNISAQFTSGIYSGKTLFSATYKVPMDVVTLYDVAVTQRVYTAYYNAGDKELGFNQRCSYGQPTAPAMTLQFSASMDMNITGLATAVSGRVSVGYQVLYYL